MATFPWYGNMVLGDYGAAEFLSVQEYPNIDRWVETIWARKAVQRGRIVNLNSGPEEHRVSERHEAGDIDKVRALMMAERAEEPAV
jgi:GST-like protein